MRINEKLTLTKWMSIKYLLILDRTYPALRSVSRNHWNHSPKPGDIFVSSVCDHRKPCLFTLRNGGEPLQRIALSRQVRSVPHRAGITCATGRPWLT